MRKYFYTLLLLLLTICISCQKRKNLKEYTLCDVNKIYLPTYFQEDFGKNPHACSGRINLKGKVEHSEKLSINFCTYARNYGKRDQFEILKMFFEEEYEEIQISTPEINILNVSTKNKEDYYYFSYDLTNPNDDCYILKTIYAYENGFVSIFYKTDKNNKIHIDKMKEIINHLRFKDIDKCIDIKMLRMRCTICESMPNNW